MMSIFDNDNDNSRRGTEFFFRETIFKDDFLLLYEVYEYINLSIAKFCRF